MTRTDAAPPGDLQNYGDGGRVNQKHPGQQEREDWGGLSPEDYDRVLKSVDGDGGWEMPGPVSARFLASDARVRGIMGPYGSGKTVTCFFDGLFKLRQQPRAKDGVRYMDSVVVADTYGSMYRNTVRTWHTWFPKEWGSWKGANERPALHQLRLRDEYGEMRWNVDFVAVGDHAAEDVMDGFEPGHGFINGAARLNEDVLTFLLGRVKRGGKMSLLGERAFRLKWNGLSLDWNPPDMDHWLYKYFVLDMPKGWEFFEQPGGMDPDAENTSKLAANYYVDMIEDMKHKPNDIQRLVHNKWGFAEDGEAVYPTYGQRHRFGAAIPFNPGRKLYLGLDGGQTLNPAAVFAQRDDEGQWRILMELCPGRCGASAFADLLVRCLQDNFPNARIEVYGDPAMDAGADKENGQLSWLDTVELALGLPITIAPTNEFGPRRDAVMKALASSTPDGRPGLIVSSECPSLLAGFGGKYHFPKYKEGGKEKTRDRPNKDHPYSDVHDALQYIILSVEGLGWVQSGHGRQRDRTYQEREAEAAMERQMTGRGDAVSWGWQP